MIQRILSIFPVLLTVATLAFALQAIAPGDPARLLVEASGLSPAPPEAVAAKRQELGLDAPVIKRYLRWIVDAAQGDLGRSHRTYQPVTSMYLERMPATLALALVAAAISAVIALPLGILTAWQRGSWIDRLGQLVAVIGTAAPGFWVALMLMYVFGIRLGWLPVFGSLTPSGIILPAIVVALPNIALLTRLTRMATLEVLSADFLTVARMKGLSEWRLALRHVTPNVLAEISTMLGLQLAGLMTGAAVVEYVFAWPGIGRLAVESALVRDTPVVVGFAVMAGLIFVVVNLITDLLVARLDPRVRSL